MRQTSINTYYAIRDGELLSKVRWTVYSYLFHNGPCTAKDVAKGMHGHHKAGGTVSSRFSELERYGVVSSAGTTICPETNRTVTLWDVTKNMPEKPLKKITNKDKYTILNKAIKLMFAMPQETPMGEAKPKAIKFINEEYNKIANNKEK